MLVSILIPVYGVEQFIERCARSLFEQTYSDLEYVFVNDCTPDRSMEVLKQVMEDYPIRKKSVKIIDHEKNRGLAAARNTAYDNANGDFITIVDSDDWLELDAVELLVKKQLETGADLVSGCARMYFPDHVEELREPVNLTKEEALMQRLSNGWNNVIWGRLIRRSIVEDNHIRALEGYDMGEDKYQTALLFYYAKSVSVCEAFVYNYERRNDQSIVSQQSLEKVKRKGIQYLRNWQGIKEFFADKEPRYYEEASKQTMLYAYAMLNIVLKDNDKIQFRQITEIINHSDEKYWPLISWKRNGLRGTFLNCYGCMWMRCQYERMVRLLKRLPKPSTTA